MDPLGRVPFPHERQNRSRVFPVDSGYPHPAGGRPERRVPSGDLARVSRTGRRPVLSSAYSKKTP
jgi:hypothetical protein